MNTNENKKQTEKNNVIKSINDSEDGNDAVAAASDDDLR